MKKVQFSNDIVFISTFGNEEYDRTAQEVSKLTYKDMLELLTMKSKWKREMETMLKERKERELKTEISNDKRSLYKSTSLQEICI